MKIVHISTADTGGAGSAALRLHKGLLKEGIDSKFVCLYKNTVECEVYKFNGRYKLSLVQKILRKLKIALSQTDRNKKMLEKYSGHYEIFTFPYSDFDLLMCPQVKNADIINLHWIGEYLDYPRFFKNINKPVVWTLHDKNPALGGFHLLMDKIKNPSFAPLEEALRNAKERILKNFKDLTVVSPSHFLLNYSKNSKTLGRFPHVAIPNSIDVNIFKLWNKQEARQYFNIPEDKKIVLFLDSKGYHKGTDTIIECIEKYEYNNIQFVALGSELTKDIKNLIHIKPITDQSEMSMLYAAADVFLLPSREDNLPNMMLESLASGTPVIGFPTGGICDVIKNDFNGLLTDNLSAEALHKSMTYFFNSPEKFNQQSIREFAIETMDIHVQAKKYVRVYSNILFSNFST